MAAIFSTSKDNYRYGDVVAPQKQIPYMHYKTKDCGIIATLIFRYRPLGQYLQFYHVYLQVDSLYFTLALLQANGIVPLTPPVPDSPHRVDVKVRLTDEEDDEIPKVILEKERALIVCASFHRTLSNCLHVSVPGRVGTSPTRKACSQVARDASKKENQMRNGAFRSRGNH